jgi:hypothetical protein
VDQVIEKVATGLGDAVGALADKGILFVVFAPIWVAFGFALIWSQGTSRRLDAPHIPQTLEVAAGSREIVSGVTMCRNIVSRWTPGQLGASPCSADEVPRNELDDDPPPPTSNTLTKIFSYRGNRSERQQPTHRPTVGRRFGLRDEASSR